MVVESVTVRVERICRLGVVVHTVTVVVSVPRVKRVYGTVCVGVVTSVTRLGNIVDTVVIRVDIYVVRSSVTVVVGWVCSQRRIVHSVAV